MHQNCAFCLEPNIISCLNRSLYHKHNEEEIKQSKVIDQLISRQKSASRIRFVQMIMQGDQRQQMNQYLNYKSASVQYKDLLQYYKYRIFVPVFSKSESSDRALTYYYQKLKHYYNSVKRKLNITIQESLSSEEGYSFDSRSYTRLNTKQQILKSIKIQLEQDKKKKKIPNISSFKTESKALEQLVSYLRLNPKFDNIKTLKTEDCFDEQNIFQETVHKKLNNKIQIHEDHFKSSLKSKLFKKIVEGANGKTNIQVIDIAKSKDPLESRSKSIKFLKSREQKQPQTCHKVLFIKYPQGESPIRSKSTLNVIPKRNSSLIKINQNHYNSPYKRKAISNEKTKGVTIQLIKSNRSRSNDHLKTKVNEECLKTKESLVKMQILKFQNTASYKSTPNSPSSSKKITRTGIQITKNDNILSIRKKKLQALKEKSGKK